MKKLKRLSVTLLVIGILIIFYGWIQSLGYDANSTIKRYVFVATGIF